MKNDVVQKLKKEGFSKHETLEDKRGNDVIIFKSKDHVDFEFDEWGEENLMQCVNKIVLHHNSKMNFYCDDEYLGKGFYDDMENLKVKSRPTTKRTKKEDIGDAHFELSTRPKKSKTKRGRSPLAKKRGRSHSRATEDTR